jgi:hypothetical protein
VLAVVFGRSILHVAAAKGTVEGILYASDGSTVVIDGQILKEGDNLYGVAIVRIHRDRVEFERDKTRWSQGIRESPHPEWLEAEQGRLMHSK